MKFLIPPCALHRGPTMNNNIQSMLNVLKLTNIEQLLHVLEVFLVLLEIHDCMFQV